MFLIASKPVWILGLPLVVLPTLLAIAGVVVLRRFVQLDRLRTNNEVAGFKFATIGVLYAVLLAFAVIVVWEKFSEAEKSVAQEAGAAATIFRLARGMAAPTDTAVRDALGAYVRAAIESDWPAMHVGKGSADARGKLDAVYDATLAFSPPDGRGSALLSEVLHQLDQITEARRVRLVLAAGAVPGVLWVVLFGGAVLTVGFTFFFGTENVRAQAAMTGALALLTFAGLFVIVAIDHPFTGSVRVEPDALETILAAFAPG